MSVIPQLKKYLGSLDHLTDESSDGKKDYTHPKLRNLGVVSLVLVREIVAPAVFRNQEAEITDITVGGKRFVRAVPNKFKHRERANGLKLLRHFGTGGAYPQNRHAMPEKAKPSAAFDLNSLVFGDSVNQGNKVLPVKAAALYSDGLSLMPYEYCVDKTFHNRAAEDGSLFDAAKKENSNNLFERHFVKPGTLMVQVISCPGRIMPVEAFEHLVLSLGLSGAYGGQTSVTGVNVRTHIAGIYASLIERPETSPYVIADQVEGTELASVIEKIHALVAPHHEVAIPATEAESYRAALSEDLLGGSGRLREAYGQAHGAVAHLFDAWFSGQAS
ncbi:type I-D CRISPR-associated protein Cas7/Csc2 [Telmatospirillum sp. J64-1]|uniref:type I-D CRISPR-associated protein Cas7/Csc2 n=1 Tax=Telmatospirillum sp. J64-1 TaxID=2502183 RepID=UPI00115E7F14|nr:type I-D CRISPR-associated protein Cas7/Csc2 [Telmatospirillum sp. J64-1]